MIVVSYHGDLKEVQGDPALAAAIDARALGPFDRLAWWRLLEEHCGLKPLIAVAREGDDIAVLPLQAGRGHLRALANWYSFWTGPAFSESAVEVPRAIELMGAIARDLHRRAWRVTMAPLRSEGWDLVILTKAFAAAGWVFWNEQSDVNRVENVSLYADYAEYLGARPGQVRTTLKRKAGRVECTIHTDFDDAAWEDYTAVYRASWKPEEGSFPFLRAFAWEEAAAGRLRLAIARQQGLPVAAQLWTVESGTAFIHKLAHTEGAKGDSPGTMLTAALFRHVIDVDHVAQVDFGTGDDAYKAGWLADVRPRFELDLFDPLSPRAWPHIARRKLRGLVRAPGHG